MGDMPKVPRYQKLDAVGDGDGNVCGGVLSRMTCRSSTIVLDRLDDVRQLSQDDAQRIGEQPRLVSRFYDVVTRFYEFGCGIGGPLVNIARATGARITGINFNSHQIRRGEDRVRRAGLEGSCAFLYADYMKVPLDDCTFDALSSFARIPAGRALTAEVTRALERLRLAPVATSEAARFLNVAADALVEAGELGIFTSSFLIHARKPA